MKEAQPEALNSGCANPTNQPMNSSLKRENSSKILPRRFNFKNLSISFSYIANYLDLHLEEFLWLCV